MFMIFKINYCFYIRRILQLWKMLWNEFYLRYLLKQVVFLHFYDSFPFTLSFRQMTSDPSITGECLNYLQCLEYCLAISFFIFLLTLAPLVTFSTIKKNSTKFIYHILRCLAGIKGPVKIVLPTMVLMTIMLKRLNFK